MPEVVNLLDSTDDEGPIPIVIDSSDDESSRASVAIEEEQPRRTIQEVIELSSDSSSEEDEAPSGVARMPSAQSEADSSDDEADLRRSKAAFRRGNIASQRMGSQRMGSQRMGSTTTVDERKKAAVPLSPSKRSGFGVRSRLSPARPAVRARMSPSSASSPGRHNDRRGSFKPRSLAFGKHTDPLRRRSSHSMQSGSGAGKKHSTGLHSKQRDRVRAGLKPSSDTPRQHRPDKAVFGAGREQSPLSPVGRSKARKQSAGQGRNGERSSLFSITKHFRSPTLSRSNVPTSTQRPPSNSGRTASGDRFARSSAAYPARSPKRKLDSDDDSLMGYGPVFGGSPRSLKKLAPKSAPKSKRSPSKPVKSERPTSTSRPPLPAQHLSEINRSYPKAKTDRVNVGVSGPSPRKRPPGLNGVKAQVPHLHVGKISAGKAVSRGLAHREISGDKKRPHGASTGSFTASFGSKIARGITRRQSKKAPPPPPDGSLVALGRKGNMSSRNTNRNRKFATGKPGHESSRKGAVRFPSEKRGSDLKWTTKSFETKNDTDVDVESRKTVSDARESHRIDRAVSPPTRLECQAEDDFASTRKSAAAAPRTRQVIEDTANHDTFQPVAADELHVNDENYFSRELEDLAGEKSSNFRSGIPLAADFDEPCARLSQDASGSALSVSDRVCRSPASDTETSPATEEGSRDERSKAVLGDGSADHDLPLAASNASSIEESQSNAWNSDALSSSDSDDAFVETESQSSLEALLKVDDSDLSPWVRSTRKKINYRETGRLELTEEQMYLPSRGEIREPTVPPDATVDSCAVSEERKRKRRMSEAPCYAETTPPPITDEFDGAIEDCAHIDHLSRYTYDDLGRPTRYFSVMARDETIYDLKIEVRESSIPGADLGAFLTFLGARIPKSRGNQIEPEHLNRELMVVHDADGMIPLEATTPDGFDVSVSLTGSSLVGKTCDVLGESHRSDGHQCSKIIGVHGMYDEADFVPKKDMKFDLGRSILEIGRYGPVKKTDRLIERDHDLKSFIFSGEPEDFGFGVEERLLGMEQVVDITDNATGLPHKDARRLIPSYINETGHDEKLKQNVNALVKDGRVVHYYLDLERPLQNGETIELLVHYGEHYEEVRERKGYGIANIEKGERDNSHEPTALRRYFGKRDLVTQQIENFDTLDVYYALEFIVENIQRPIDSIIADYLGGRQGAQPTCLQWRAKCRIHWLGDLFLKHTQFLLDDLPAEYVPPAYPPRRSLLKQAKKWAIDMKWDSFADAMLSLKNRDETAYETLIAASREDVLYRLSEEIVMPLNESMWCPVAVDLQKRLSKHTAIELSLGGDDVRRRLVQKYLSTAKDTAKAIRKACKDHRLDGQAPGALVFASGVTEDQRIDLNTLEWFEGFKDDFFSRHTIVPKGTLASLMDIQAYRDAMALGCLPDQLDLKFVTEKSQEFLIACESEKADGTINRVVGYPRRADALAREGQINKTWYLLWQVVLVVHSFAEEFVGDEHYSLQELCDTVKVDFDQAKRVVEQGIDTKEYTIEFVGEKKKKRKKKRPSQRKPRTPTSAGGSKLNQLIWDEVIWKTLVDLGWTLDFGTRPRDFYFLPPGVKRQRGFSNRVHYFDSKTLVTNFISTDPRWKDRPEVMEALNLLKRLEELRAKQKNPITILDVERLRQEGKTDS